LLAFAASAAASSQSGPSGNGVTPQVVAANADCTQVQASSHSPGPPAWSQYTNDQSSTGTFTSPDGQLIVNLSSSDQTTFSFTVADSSPTKVVQAVIADDSQAGNFYDYSPQGTSGDANLHPPPEQSRATAAWFISRLQFCYVPPRQTPAPPTSQTSSPTPVTAPVTTTAPSAQGLAGQKVAANKHKKKHKKARSRPLRKRVGFTG
jgi:hypothetical protein